VGPERVFAAPLANLAPYGQLKVNYSYQAPTPAPTSSVPGQNNLTVSKRKIQPLLGEKTSIQYALTSAGNVTIRIYNLRGEWVKTLVDSYHSAGRYTIEWGAETASNALAASGVYVIYIKTPFETKTQKVIVIK
jgi:flagellar hook assembly protein FlgD